MLSITETFSFYYNVSKRTLLSNLDKIFCSHCVLDCTTFKINYETNHEQTYR